MAEESTNEELELDPSLIVEEQETPEKPEPAKEETEEDDVPEKYRGKTAREIIQMHQDAERLIGRQGNEVGELRRIVDDIVASTKNAEPSKAPEPEPDFFEDPVGASARAAKKVYEEDTELQEVKSTVKEMKQRQAAQELLRRHPDAATLSNDPKFAEWVQKSSLRTNLFVQAHNNFDYEAASELFDLYKETKAYNKETERAATEKRAQDVKKASTGSAKASGETRGKPTLSREAIVNLRVQDPEKYQRLLPQLRQAYQEGRVK
jgi:type I site-specific restriction endonuclease